MTLIISEIALRMAVADPEGGPRVSPPSAGHAHGPAGERDGPERPALTPLQRREIVDEAVRVTLRVLAMGEGR